MLELCLSQDINEGDIRGFSVKGHNLFAVKRNGALFTVETGECITGPCAGQPLTPATFERQGERILIDMDQFDALQSTPS
jgi:nitrite reductase/ring-hydroxylating ferredoxin subunit